MMGVSAPTPASDSLREIAASRGLLYGAAATKTHLSSDSEFVSAFAKQCGILVPEVELKWDKLRPVPDKFEFGPADWLYEFAQQHEMKFRGHTLVWYKALPKWFASYVNNSNAKQLLLTHINTVVGRYANKVHSWDVINEAVSPEDKRNDGLRNTPWMQLLGPEYIDTAFHAAAEADPRALLTWNENLLEEESVSAETRRGFFLQNLKELVRRKVPIHAIGIQSHLPGDKPVGGSRFQDFLRSVSDLGLKIMITEMDVRDESYPADVSTRDRLVAERYHQYLSAVLQQHASVAVLTWGLSDRYTSVATYHPRKDGTAVRPLPLDASMNPTPATSAIARAFGEAAPR